VRSGALTQLHTAFSREGAAKVYVQHRMVEPEVAPRLWALLQAEAHVYIAGAANQMPKDVRRALRSLASEHGGLDEEGAQQWLQQLEARGRLQCETW
jgi:sulfite reductase alpha subunit-like flavoprotein